MMKLAFEIKCLGTDKLLNKLCEIFTNESNVMSTKLMEHKSKSSPNDGVISEFNKL